MTAEEMLAAHIESSYEDLAHFNDKHDPSNGQFAKKGTGTSEKSKRRYPSKKKESKAGSIVRKAIGAAVLGSAMGPKEYAKYKAKEMAEVSTRDKSTKSKIVARTTVKAAIEALEQSSKYNKTKKDMQRSGTWNSDVESRMKNNAAYHVGKTAVKKAVQEYKDQKIAEFLQPRLQKMADKAAAKKKAEYEARMAEKKSRSKKTPKTQDEV